MIDFRDIKSIAIPEGEVAVIARGSEIMWQKLKLPIDYKEVDYIESTGTQYIDTGLRMNENSKLEMLVSHFSTEVQRMVFGSRSSATENNFSVVSGPVGGIMSIVTDFDNYTNNRLAYVINGNEFLEISISKEKLKINDLEQAVSTYKTFTTPGTAYLFNGNGSYPTGYTPAIMRLYFCRIYDNDVLVRDFIPCYRKSDGEVGMYDLVTKTFFTNRGSGEFYCEKPKYKTELAYIESTGTQWIDTGFLPNAKSGYDLRGDFDNHVGATRFGARNGLVGQSVDGAFACLSISTNYLRLDYGSGTIATAQWTLNSQKRANRIIVDGTSKTASVYFSDGTSDSHIYTSGDFTARFSVSIFAFNSGGTCIAATAMKVSACKLYDNGILVRDFIPVLDWNNVPCMYDKVTDELFYNQGTGEFLYEELAL